MSRLRNVRSVTLVLTSGCNLSCSYCYQNAKSGRRMSPETARVAVDTLLDSRQEEVGLTFYGGEPMIHYDLIREVVEYVEVSRRVEQEVGYYMITNGTLLGEAEVDYLAGHDFNVQVSFDGTPAVQNLRGEGSFELLDGLLDRIAVDHPDWFSNRVSISATVLPSTIRHLADSVEYFLSRGVASIGFSPGNTDTSSWQLDQIREVEEQFERIFQMSLRIYRRTGQIPVECLRDPNGPRRLPEPHAMCNVERAEGLTVDVDGEVYGCSMFAESFQEFPSDFLGSRLSRMRLGGLSQPGLTERMDSYPLAVASAEIFHHHDRKHSGYGDCGSCEFLDTCFVCPVSIGKIPGNSDPHRIPDFLCAFSLVSNRTRVRLAAELSPWEWLKRAAAR